MLDLTGKGGPCNNNNDKNKDLWSFPELMQGDSVLPVQDCTDCSSLQDRGCCECNMDISVCNIFHFTSGYIIQCFSNDNVIMIKKKKSALDGKYDFTVGCILLVCSFAQFYG